MIEQTIKDVLLSHLGALQNTPNGWQRRNCPMCTQRGHSPDKKKRFGVKFPPEGGAKAHCFNCDFLTSWRPGWDFPKPLGDLMEAIGVPHIDVRRIKFDIYKENNSIVSGDTGEIVVSLPVTTKWTPVDLPEGSYPLEFWIMKGCDDNDFKKVVEYAYGRGIRDFSSVYWCPSREKQLNRRLIIPFKYNRRIVGYTGRYYGNPNSKMIPKYLNIMPEAYLYNLDAQNDYEREYVILTEGILDGYFVDGVAALHSTLNEEQIRIINNLGKQVVLCPDRDKDGDELVKIALKNKWAVSFPNWGDDIKDAGSAVESYGRIITVKSILDGAVTNPIQINVNRKLDAQKWRKND